jgi:hypothetical protein
MFDLCPSIPRSSLLVAAALASACAEERSESQTATALTSDIAEVVAAPGPGSDWCPNWVSGPGTCVYAGRRMPGPLYYSAVATGQLDDRNLPIYDCVISAFCSMESTDGEDPMFDVGACHPAMWADDCPEQLPRQASFVMSQVVASSLSSATSACYQDYVIIGDVRLTGDASTACNQLEARAEGTLKCCVRKPFDPNRP